jgi:DNA-binding beta-propeller fold protein YncE
MLPHSGPLPQGALLVAALAVGCAEEPRSLARPNHVAVGGDGSVWVSDFQHDTLVRWSPDGTFLGRWGRNGLGPDELWRVTAMAATADGLVVANLRPESDASDAALVTELKRLTAEREVSTSILDGRTLEPGARIDGIAVLKNGHLVLADSAHDELVEVDEDGRRIGRYGGVPRPDAEPHTVTPSGADLWVVERDRHRVTIVSAGGREQAFVPRDEPFRFPTAVAVCDRADPPWVAVADQGNHRIRRFLTDGTPLASFSPHSEGPDQPVQLLDVAVSPDCGSLYVVDSKGDRVLVTDPNGTVRLTLRTW